jgi:hypothetical protein
LPVRKGECGASEPAIRRLAGRDDVDVVVDLDVDFYVHDNVKVNSSRPK